MSGRGLGSGRVFAEDDEGAIQAYDHPLHMRPRLRAVLRAGVDVVL